MVDPNRGSVDRGKYMTRTEAAKLLGVPQERIAPLVARGRLKGLWRGHWLYIERESANNQIGHVR